jgi:hypothetical protein
MESAGTEPTEVTMTLSNWYKRIQYVLRETKMFLKGHW